MSSEEISLQNGLNVFQDDPLRAFNCGPTSTANTTTRPGPKTRELTGFIDDKMFSFPPSQPPDFRSSNIYAAAAAAAASADRRDPPTHHHRNWGSSAGGGSTHSGDDESDGDDVDDEEDEDDDVDVDDDEGGDGDETNNNHNNNNNNNNSSNININNHKNKINSGNETVNNAGTTNPEKMGNGKAKHSFVGESCRELVVKEGGSGLGQGVRESNSNNNYQNAVTIADPDGDIYYTQYLQGGEGSGGSGGGVGGGQKDIVVENGGSGCGFSGRKDVSFSNESGESLRGILSDPVTGTLMDDAMILPCGHSFGAAGIQHVLRMKVCYTCSHSVSEESVAPNLSLRAAVQAFRREEELQFYRSPKRRRERFDQDKSNYGDSNMMDPPRGRGVQFPFAVTDRVIIKGNKRTPQRFVGREAVVTTQCLNGWYVVKTLDNAESVKLQYRSLAKVPDDPSSKPMTSKMGPNWL